MRRVTIIAEAGVNHNGDLHLAHQLVDAAADAGADYIKFQTFKASSLLRHDAPKATYQSEVTDRSEGQYEMIRRLELTHNDHIDLYEYCRRCGIKFLSTAFDIDSLQLLDQLGIDLCKVPSGEITNVPYLRQVARLQRPILLSTGIATLAEIESALTTLHEAGADRKSITVLHCNTQYPTPMSDVNLRAIGTIAQAFKVDVGYSDHTLGIEVPVAAVALGASVIEKHFTTDRSLPGPDHRASLEPDELKMMISSIRHVEQALGDGLKRPSASELPNRDVVRKSIVAAAAIQCGERLTEQNLTVKRPGNGVSPLLWDQVIGRIATRSYQPDEMIEW